MSNGQIMPPKGEALMRREQDRGFKEERPTRKAVTFSGGRKGKGTKRKIYLGKKKRVSSGASAIEENGFNSGEIVASANLKSRKELFKKFPYGVNQRALENSSRWQET